MLFEKLLEFRQKLGHEGLRVDGRNYRGALESISGAALLFTVPTVGLMVLAKAGHTLREHTMRRNHLEESYDNGLSSLIEFLQNYSA